MDEFVQQFRALLERPIITLGDEPVQAIQIALLIGILAGSVVVAGFLRRWSPPPFQSTQDAGKSHKSIARVFVSYRSNFRTRFGVPNCWNQYRLPWKSL